MSSYIMQGETANVPIAILAVFGIGLLIGLANGLIITKLKVNPFIATLGMSLIIKGIINATFSNYTGSVPKSFEFFGYGTIGPIPVSIIIMLISLPGRLVLACPDEIWRSPVWCRGECRSCPPLRCAEPTGS